MRFNIDDEAFKNKERGKYGNKNTYFLPAKKQYRIKEDVMIYTRKLRYLILFIFLFGFCFSSFVQAEEKKPIEPGQIVVCPKCPLQTQPNSLIQIDFTGLTTSTYTITGPNAPLPFPGSTPFGRYAITSDPGAFNNQWIPNSQLPPSQGNILICDGYGDKETKLFGKEVSCLPGRRYIFCARFININKIESDMHIEPKVKLRIATVSGTVLNESPEKTLLTNAPWELLSFVWVCPPGVTYVTPEIWLTSKALIGNDVGVDDISFVECKPLITLCDCDSWDPVTVRWTEPAPSGMQTRIVKCGDFIPICRRCRNTPIELKFKMSCKPSSCTPSYTWDVIDSNNNIIANGNATAICDVVFDPTPGPQNYTVSVRAGCGNNKCGKCEIKIYTCEIVNCVECRCLRCDPVQIEWMTPGGGLSGTISCGGKGISVGDVCQCQKISLNFNCGCIPNPDECKLTYTWEITGPNTYQLSGGPQTSGNISFIPTEPGLYSITVIPKCGETVCTPCKVNVTVTGIVLCK